MQYQMNLPPDSGGNDLPPGMVNMELHFRLSDIDPDEEIPEEDDEECTCQLDATSLGDGLFRAESPVSLTWFGPIGTTMGFGDIFEATPEAKGIYGLVRIVEEAKPWTKTIPAAPESLQVPALSGFLSELIERGGMWELAVGNLTLQVHRGPEEEAPPPWFKDLTDRVVEVCAKLPHPADRGRP